MDLLESLRGTYAVMGQEMSDLGLELMVDELSSYPLRVVQTALSRCRKELKRLTLAEILDRLDDGRPGVEEAWATIATAMHEDRTIVWTDEMREAYGTAHLLADDLVAARMAFKERYGALVRAARDRKDPPQWSVSLGYNPAGRELAISEGVKQGRLTPRYAKLLLPDSDGVDQAIFSLAKRISDDLPPMLPAD